MLLLWGLRSVPLRVAGPVSWAEEKTVLKFFSGERFGLLIAVIIGLAWITFTILGI